MILTSLSLILISQDSATPASPKRQLRLASPCQELSWSRKLLRQVLLLQRDVPKATRFYQEGLGLRVKVLTERWAELEAGSTTLALKAVEGCVQFSRPLYAMEQFCYSPDGMSGPTDLHREAYCTTGYTPFLSFSVVDLQQTVSNMLQLGATLDGPIKYPGNGKVAAVRAPDGQMLSLYEADAT